ncbi:hypothetical protein B9K06_08400 [Bacillus sp. OG2]|nr:hypothetical protein B9K06_08400 [Bacillus sp. OG2]
MGIEANQYEVHILKNQKMAPHLAGYIPIHLSAESFGAFNKIGPRHKKTFTEQQQLSGYFIYGYFLGTRFGFRLTCLSVIILIMSIFVFTLIKRNNRFSHINNFHL